jgi:hypothetical protein
MRLATLISGTTMMIAAILSAQQFPPPADSQAPPPEQQQADDAAPDEPGRPVARLSVLSGDASVMRGDSGDWVAAALNAPLMAGDSVSVAPGGAVELQLDRANFARLAGDSEARIANLESGHFQIQLAKGLVTYRVLRSANGQPEISTPLVAVHAVREASVRVEVAPDGSNRITVRHGDADIATSKGVEHLHQGNVMIVQGTADDPEYQVENAPAHDQWDNWSDQRDAYLLRAQSPQYVSPDIAGAEDLDPYGRWSYDPAYGNVWTPSVPSTWAPYQNGQWAWEDYYGWTWVDYDPWGWAPFHYGSWYQRPGFGWCWFPGPRHGHSWWRPALVGFVGFGRGLGVGFGFGNIGWVPLAPYERFHPWYGRGGWGGGFNRVNIVHETNITNVYRNARFSNGVTAVSAADFQRGNFRNPVAVDRGQLQRASLVHGAVPVTPSGENLRFSNRSASMAAPRSDPGNQRFFSRGSSAASTPARTPFAQQQAAVRSAFESRGIQTGGSSPGRFAGPANAGNNGFAVPRSASSPGWQRFGSPQAPAGTPPSSGGAPRSFDSSPSRSVPVAPPIVHQQYQPSYNRSDSPAPSNPGRSFGAPSYRTAPSAPPAPRSAPAPNYRSAPEPSYRTAPAPSYRSAPEPSYRSAPEPSYRTAPAPNYRSAPAQSYRTAPTPSYRTAPAPSYRSAPAPSSRSAPAPRSSGGGGGGGGGNRSSGGHGGGRR